MSDESLFREVDEEVRQEQLKKLWDRYGNYVIALCLGIVIAVAALKGWQYWELRQSEAAAASYANALKLIEENKRTEADDALKTPCWYSGYVERWFLANGEPLELPHKLFV